MTKIYSVLILIFFCLSTVAMEINPLIEQVVSEVENEKGFTDLKSSTKKKNRGSVSYPKKLLKRKSSGKKNNLLLNTVSLTNIPSISLASTDLENQRLIDSENENTKIKSTRSARTKSNKSFSKMRAHKGTSADQRKVIFCHEAQEHLLPTTNSLTKDIPSVSPTSTDADSETSEDSGVETDDEGKPNPYINPNLEDKSQDKSKSPRVARVLKRKSSKKAPLFLDDKRNKILSSNNSPPKDIILPSVKIDAGLGKDGELKTDGQKNLLTSERGRSLKSSSSRRKLGRKSSEDRKNNLFYKENSSSKIVTLASAKSEYSATESTCNSDDDDEDHKGSIYSLEDQNWMRKDAQSLASQKKSQSPHRVLITKLSKLNLRTSKDKTESMLSPGHTLVKRESPFERPQPQLISTAPRIATDLQNYLLTGDIENFEQRIKNIESEGMIATSDPDQRIYAITAAKGGYPSWAASFRGEIIFGKNIKEENQSINLIKQKLFFGIEWGDFDKVNSAVEDLKSLGVNTNEICYENLKTPKHIAQENNFPLWAKQLSRKDGSFEEGEEQLIRAEILEKIHNELMNGDRKDQFNFLSWYVVGNSADLIKAQYTGTILAWLVENEFTFNFNIGIEDKLIKISFNKEIWGLVRGEMLLSDKEKYEFSQKPDDYVQEELLKEISTLIQKGGFLDKVEDFWKIVTLIDQGMDIEQKFDGKNGKKTLAQLAAARGQNAFALALKNKVFWGLFSKKQLFAHMKNGARSID